MKLMVFDVGGTEIKYSVMDETLEPANSGSVPTPQDTQQHFFETIEALYRPHADEVEGVAMSLPGIIDSKKGRCNGGGWLTYNHRTSIAPELSALLGRPVRIFNDGKCAACAELRAGSLRNVPNASVFIIGTGVGGGLIIDGQILNGRHYSAGEFSFVRNRTDLWPTMDGAMGLLCSTTGLLAHYRELASLPSDAPLNGRIFFARVAEGESAAVRTLDDFTAEVAKSIMNLQILLDIERVAIGGGISRQPILIEKIREALTDLYTNPDYFNDPVFVQPEVVPCRFSSEANQVGAYFFYRDAQ